MNTGRHNWRLGSARAHAAAWLCALLCVVGQVPATTVKEGETEAPPETATSPSAPGEAVADLLRVLREGQLLPEDAPEVRRRMLEALIEALGCGGGVLPEGVDADSREEGADSGRGLCTTATVGGMFAYVRIEEVAKQAVTTIDGFLGDVDYGHYEGVIVDLRYTLAGNAEAAREAADALGRTKLPVAVLINRETAGPAEILAALTKKQCGAAMVGEPTRGFPFGWQQLRLACGDVVLLPSVPRESRGTPWKPTPLAVDVLVKQRLPRDALAKNTGADRVEPVTDRDLCLRKAVDLLTTIRALRNKHF